MNMDMEPLDPECLYGPELRCNSAGEWELIGPQALINPPDRSPPVALQDAGDCFGKSK